MLYFLSDVFSWLFYHVIRYRRKLILENLRNSFPGKPEAEIASICRSFYRNLCDNILEALKGFTLSRKEIENRYRILPNEDLERVFSEGKSALGLTGHLANWEWGTYALGIYIEHKILGVYKKIHHPQINQLLIRSRSKYNIDLCEMKETSETFEKMSSKESILLMLIADQRPTNPDRAYWTTFMNRDTPFFYGPEKFAHEYDLPVFFFCIERVKRGYYEVEIKLLHKNPATLPEGKVIELFRDELEKQILKRNADWLWSHSRWKHRKPAQIPLDGNEIASADQKRVNETAYKASSIFAGNKMKGNIGQTLGFVGLLLIISIFRILPFRILYILSDGMAFTLFYIIPYRKRMILKNMAICFPEKSPEEIKILCREFYRNLSDVVIETFKGFTLTGPQIARRYKVLPNEDLEQLYNEGKSVMGLIAHQGNWEWIPHGLGLTFRHHITAVYKRVKQPYVNDYMVNSRSRFDVILRETKEIADYLSALPKDEIFMLMLIADQRPADPNKSYWTKFLNRDTAFFYGPQKYMQEYQLPAFFFNIRRVKRGFYEIDAITLTKYPDSLEEGEIIEIFRDEVEKEVRRRPADWLWSHNRWKHAKPEYASQVYSKLNR